MLSHFDQSDGWSQVTEPTWVRFPLFRSSDSDWQVYLLERFFFAFGQGARVCIGRSTCNNLFPSLLEIHIVTHCPILLASWNFPSYPFQLYSTLLVIEKKALQWVLTDSDVDLSWMEMSKLIPTLFFHFEVELTHPTAELKETCWCAICLDPWPSDHEMLM